MHQEVFLMPWNSTLFFSRLIFNSLNCYCIHIVWKLLKMSHLNFWILAFSTNFCPIKSDLSGNTVWPQVFQCWMRLFLWFSNTMCIAERTQTFYEALNNCSRVSFFTIVHHCVLTQFSLQNYEGNLITTFPKLPEEQMQVSFISHDFQGVLNRIKNSYK